MISFVRRALRLCALTSIAAAPAITQEPVDHATVDRIRDEAMNRSQIMETMSWLTDVYGPRLTGSPNAKTASEWAMKTMAGWGVQNTHLEAWPFHYTGWRNDRFALQVTGSNPFPVLAAPRAWSPAPLKGVARGEAMLVVLDSLADTSKYAGKLKGKFVMLSPAPELKSHFDADARRYTDVDLAKMAAAPLPTPSAGGGGRPPAANTPAARALAARIALARLPNDTNFLKFLAHQGASGLLLAARGDYGTVFTDNGAPRVKVPPVVPAVHVAAEHYGRMARMLDKGVAVPLELTMQNTIAPDTMSYNVIGEIPGTDPALKDEIVMLGGHFDSWHAGTGATDNAAGSAVMMEALRIFQTLGLKPRRTIRIALWTGEEQGLFGSREYVKAHFGSRTGDTVTTKAEYDRFSGYFNVDNGTGRIRGVFLQGNPGVKSIFDAWLQPFWANGAQTISFSNTGGTDHLAFDGIGLPGWQFIQDPIDYSTRTHHSNQDVYERIQADDMKHNAAVVASFVWMTAQRDAKLPRKAGYVLKPAVTP